MSGMEIRPIHPCAIDELYAIYALGWRWMSYIGWPVRGTPGYRSKRRVRMFMSPERIKNEEWADFLKRHEGREADGTEPLAYDYCSSGCRCEPVPSLLDSDLAVKLSRIVHSKCEDVPHDIGITLAEAVVKHLNRAFENK